MAEDEAGSGPRPPLLLSSGALPILLSHDSIAGSQQLVAQLLQTSKSLADVVSQELVGSVDVAFSATGRASLRHVPGLADWLGRYAHIVQACDVCFSVDVADCQLAERTLALGLHTGAEAKGLHMQSYEHHGGTASVHHILRQLPSPLLLHLHLCFDEEASDISAVGPALARLTSLTSLTLRSGCVDPLLVAASSLTRLSVLRASAITSVACLASLPSSIVDMQVSCDEEDSRGEPQVLQLAHLTHCTSLQGSHLALHSPQDRLPPGLQQLGVLATSSHALLALTQLTALTHLVLHDPRIDSRAQLEQVANATTQLQHVELHYGDSMVDASPWHSGFCGLPIRALHMCLPGDAADYLTVPEAAVAGLTCLASSLQELCCLGSHVFSCVIEATPKQLAESVKQLTGLERIAIKHVEFEHVLGDDDISLQESLDARCLFEALAGLPNLRDLAISLNPDTIVSGVAPPPGPPHPATALAAAGSSLTRLGLQGCGMCDFAVVALALDLSALCALDLDDNMDVRDASLPAIAAGLPQLTGLSLQRTGVTNAGVVWLSRLAHLQSLAVPSNISEEAISVALRGADRFERSPEGVYYVP